MRREAALIVAGIFFGIITLVHLSRLIFKFNLIIGGYSIPLWPNIIGLCISLTLCIWMFLESKK